MRKLLKNLIRPLRSRKVRTAIVTVIAAYAAQAGLEVSEEVLLGIIGVGVSVILGIAIEDAGAKSVGKRPSTNGGTGYSYAKNELPRTGDADAFHEIKT